jgi:hypothetical protein
MTVGAPWRGLALPLPSVGPALFVACGGGFDLLGRRRLGETGGHWPVPPVSPFSHETGGPVCVAL